MARVSHCFVSRRLYAFLGVWRKDLTGARTCFSSSFSTKKKIAVRNPSKPFDKSGVNSICMHFHNAFSKRKKLVRQWTAACIYFSVFAQNCRRVNQDFNVPPLRRLQAPYRPVPLNDVIVSGWLKAASRSKACARSRLQYFGRCRLGLLTHWKGEHRPIIHRSILRARAHDRAKKKKVP